MLTIILAIVDAFSPNPNFKPHLLYFITFMLDLCLIDALSDYISNISKKDKKG